MTNLGTQQHHASNALALAGLLVLAAMIVLGITAHSLPGIFWQAIAIGGTLAFAYINFKNTFVTNSAWKSYGGWLMAFAVVIIYWIAYSKSLK